MVTDAGHTEIPPGTVTVVGIGPGPREVIDKITGDLSLVN
jgi:PTH2 family peptidyl-tRNA hydrolase